MNDLPVESNQLLLLWLNKAGFQIKEFWLVETIRQWASIWNPFLGTDHKIKISKSIARLKISSFRLPGQPQIDR